MFAKDIMTRNVITVTPETLVQNIATLLIKRNISAVPVVDTKGVMVGIVSEGDLVHRIEGDHSDEIPRSWWLKLIGDVNDTPISYAKSHGSKASDVMTRSVITVTEFASIAEIAVTLEKYRVKRLPVVRDGKIVGIVSRANVIQALVDRDDDQLPQIAEDDREIRNRLLKELEQHPWANNMTLNITVNNGVVRFFGYVESDEARRAMHIAAENITGVKSIEDHLGVSNRFAYDPI